MAGQGRPGPVRAGQGRSGPVGAGQNPEIGRNGEIKEIDEGRWAVEVRFGRVRAPPQINT